MNIEKVHKAALRVVYNDYTTSYSWLFDMPNRIPLYLARLKGLLVEVFKGIREFMNSSFVMDNKCYDTRSRATISQNRVKTLKYGIQSFAYQGAKCEFYVGNNQYLMIYIYIQFYENSFNA